MAISLPKTKFRLFPEKGPGESRRLDALTGARAASLKLYTGGQGVYNVMPMLQFASQREKTDMGMVKDNPLLFGPAWKISFRIGSLPIKVYHLHKDDGERKEHSQHPSYLLLRRPNDILTRPLLISGTVYSLLQWGRVGWYKNRPRKGAPPEELWPIPGEVLFPVLDPNSLIDHFEIRIHGQEPVKIPKEDICYFRLMVDPQNWAEGMSPMQSLGMVADYGKQAIDAATDFFEHALLGRMWVDMGLKELTPAARARLQAQMEVARRDRYAVPVLEDGAQLKNMGKEPTGEVLHGAVNAADALITDVMGLPSTATSARWTPAEEQKLFYGEVVQPIADAIEQELERSYFTEWGNITFEGKSGPLFGEFQFREILAGDPQQRALLWQTKILSGQATPNDARRAENLPPIEGGDEAMVPLNLRPLKEVLEPPEPQQATPPRDTAGGTGGSQGKGTLPDAQPRDEEGRKEMQQPRAAMGMRSSLALQTNWRLLRARTLHSQGEAARRRLKGVLRDELRGLRTQLTPQPPASEAGLPSLTEMAAVLHGSNDSYRQVLQGFMEQTARDAHEAAGELVGRGEDQFPDFLVALFAARSQQVSDRFTERRIRQLEQTLQATQNPAEVLTQLSEDWEHMLNIFASGMAVTETAWAHEQSVLDAWARGGVTQFQVIGEVQECETGVCTRVVDAGPYALRQPIENIGYSFEDADAPPLHPHCGCYLLPVFD